VPDRLAVVPQDTAIIKPDSLNNLSSADSLRTAPDSVVTQEPGDITAIIDYTAEDSILTSIDSKIIQLYGKAKIVYGDIELEADQMTIDYNTSTLTATGSIDSLGNRVGYPIFKNAEEVYETKNITYNFKTRQARITGVVTRQGDGFLHGETVFKNDKNEVLSLGNSYTTCNLAEPHFRIRSSKTKAIPNDKVISGPFHLEIMNVPTPLALPFGMFPSPRKSASGILIPAYGEETRRGFFLKDGGYFFDFNEYVKLRLTGDIYSKGGHSLNVQNAYNKRYHYTGNLNFSYTKNQVANQSEGATSSNDYRLTWSHSPKSTGTGRFSASVNAATSTYSLNNNLGVNYDPSINRMDNTSRKLSSTVSYTKTFKGTPFSAGMSARHNQDIRTKQVELQLPDFYASMRSIYPFKSNTKIDVLKKLNLRYNVKGSNKISNNLGKIAYDGKDSIAPFEVYNIPRFFQDSKKGMKHTIPLSTSFKIFKHFNISPSANYEEMWYFEKLNWGVNEDSSQVAILDTIPGFNRVYHYNFSASMNTRIYGTFPIKKGSGQAIRHTLNPSVSFSMRPDFSDPSFDFYQTLALKRSNGDEYEVYKARHERYLYGTAGSGESRLISFSLGNTLEMKVRNKADTTETASEKTQYTKVSLLRSLGMSASYNLAADSFKLSTISLRGNTSVLNNKLNINFNGTLDPYTWVLDEIERDDFGEVTGYIQHKEDVYAWDGGQGLGQLSRAGMALSTNLNPRKRDKEESTRDKIAGSNLSDADKDFLMNNPDVYVDFDIPWSLRLSYNMNYQKQGYAEARITQTMTMSGDVSLSEKWKIGARSGYDFQNKDFTQTNITISRDLHCWEMNMNWTPFGRYQSYNFVIRVKSALLQDLKINRKRSFFDR